MSTQINPNAIGDSLGGAKAVETTNSDPPIMKSSVTKGYPKVRYGRARSGRFLRITSTAAAVMPYRIQLAKMTRLNRSSYFPESTSKQAQALKTRMETPGVWYFGLTRAIAGKNNPSLAAA